MSSEKQNKAPDWKENLLQWEQTSGAEQQKDLLWEKLQVRLQPKRKKRSVYLFRAAAIFMILTVSFFLLQKRNGSIEKPAISGTIPPVSTPTRLIKEKVLPLPANPVMNPVKKRQVEKMPLLTNINNNVAVQPAQENTLPVIDPIVPAIEQQENITAPVASVVPTKKKLRVVHLNELNNPPPPTFAILKEDWNRPQRSSGVTVNEPSIWPGKNKHKYPIVLGN